MTTEHQPGSPGVDLDGIELPGVLSFLRENFVNDGAEGESVHRLCALAERMAAELRTLRARVAELETWNVAEREEGRAIDAAERAESAEARVAALEKLFDDAGEHNVLALIDHYQSEAMAESEARRAALARVGELECAEADLESQLAAAREEQGLESRVREVLGERFFQVRIGRYREFWLAEWREVVRGETLERFANAETLPALLRAILEVEAKGG